MRLDRIRRPERDINVAAIRLPSRLTRCIMVVCVLDSAVVLFAEFVIRAVRVGIAPEPELLDESFALLVVAQALESFPLFVRDDVGRVLVQPGLESPVDLFPEMFLSSELLLIRALTFQGIRFILGTAILSRGGTRLNLWIISLLRVGPGGGNEGEAAAECDKQERTAVENHCVKMLPTSGSILRSAKVPGKV